ncbi:MAG: DUF934 domain-containing protein [Proteobacteria bacterium]|nr:DUF934 domain-containing protein [Pseudomonadota bacterium]NOG59891.1 DUF934 domain-containing protein [Pseudomonadota bacterium]
MQVIKNKEVINDDWQLIREIENDAPVPEGKLIVPLAYWQANRDELLNKKSEHAVWIDGDIETEALVDDLEYFSIIALDFPAFKDGRSYSHASLLKNRYNYTGDLRAIGDVLRDQLFYMHRCGIDSYAVREDKDIEDALNSLNDFSVRYQAAADDALPIYRQR